LTEQPYLTYLGGVKLSETDSAVLAAMRLNADESAIKIAKALRLKQSSVRSSIARLRSCGAIKRYALINISTLGLVEYDITCGLSFRSSTERENFFNYLIKSPQISQVYELGGTYHCFFTVCAKNPIEVDQYLQELGAKFGPVFLNLCLGVTLRYATFPPKYLFPTCKFPRDSVVVSTSKVTIEPDQLDKKLLRALSKYGDASERDLAKILGVPHSTISYRVNKLMKSGTLVGHLNQMDAKNFGHEAFSIALSLRNVTPQLRTAIFEFAKKHPNIIYIVEWIGSYHCCLGVIARDALVASAIVNELYELLGQALNEIILTPIIKIHKAEFYAFD
jgi:DNA-binding Lrp family transcriptional regulator